MQELTNQRCALVLSGGGQRGIAWHAGMLAGLRDHGIDLATADLMVGTSAGAIVGAQLAYGHSANTIYRRVSGANRPKGPLGWPGDMARAVKHAASTLLYARYPQVAQAWAELPEMTRERAEEFGALALESPTVSEAVWIAIIRAQIGADDWPARDLTVCAVDAFKGTRVTWDRTCGVPMDRAVAASAALPTVAPPITVFGSRYIDGGFRSSTNADVARGHPLVVVLVAEPPHGKLTHLVERSLAREVAELRAYGSEVEVVRVSEAAAGPMLAGPRDSRCIADVARIARRDAADVAERLIGHCDTRRAGIA